ncbi:Plasma membrane sulfite pump involved in sulfite metabolism, partial [Linderina macrospora]
MPDTPRTEDSAATVQTGTAQTGTAQKHRRFMGEMDDCRDILRGFNPAWFTATMGTGITGVLFYGFPYESAAARYISMAIALFNVLLFVIFSALLIARAVIYRDFHRIMLHPQASMPLGAIPMGLCTIINSLIAMLKPYHTPWMPTFVLVLWCIDVVLSLLSCLSVPFLLTSHQKHSLKTMSAAWILPVVPTVVAAASGALVASVHSGWTANTIVLVSYAMWAMGVGIAMMLITIYLLRLALYKLPAKEAIVSAFIPLGPLGQSSYGIQQLGIQAQRLFPETLARIPGIGEFMHCFGFAAGLLIWALGTWWFAHAIYSVLCTRRCSRLPFNLGWWAFIFPIGTFTSATGSLYAMSGYYFFRVLDAILIAGILILWIYVMILTGWFAWSGVLFAPVAV